MSWRFEMQDMTPELRAAIVKATAKLVRKAAFDIQAQAAQNAPVATGFLKSSIYTVTHTSSGYGDAGDGNGPMLPEVEAPSSNLTAYIAVGAEYGEYVEYGTSHMGAQPYLTPAVDAVRPTFEAAMEKLEEQVKALGVLAAAGQEMYGQ